MFARGALEPHGFEGGGAPRGPVIEADLPHLPLGGVVEKEVAEFVKNHTTPDDLVVTAEYEFPMLRYYSERDVRTAARQPDFQGKYWWIWDNVDIETALRRSRRVVVITRPGTEWPVDVWGYHRDRIGEIDGRIISRVVMN